MEIEAPPPPPQEPIHIEEIKDDVPATALPTAAGQPLKEEHFDFKMDIEEQQREAADERLVILALQGISVVRDTPKGETSEKRRTKTDHSARRADTPSSHYDEQIGILTLKRQFFTSCEHTAGPGTTGISLTPKETPSLQEKVEMTPEEIAAYMREEAEKRDAIQREIERNEEERLAAILEQEEEDNAEALALSRLKRSEEAGTSGVKQESELTLMGSFDVLNDRFDP